ncbi:MarR family transcriptional regulator [Microbacterium sp. CFBP 13617]|uniref:MarR family winged helix-turn-helix transcriptional regulator n=1 Tax=Microbacterium sp. CFBP 13617 TaxID=2774035 RepID=UPI00177E9A8F|nr:helix-turn-helix domain-containing protein [Microbacterium sp. CFBP 13617]MBD8218810.1 MarR family transcriptional regulator [Microbacterium sp. CFBP 13617]
MTNESSPVVAALNRYLVERARCLAEARRILGLNEVDVVAVLHITRNPGIRPSELRQHLGVTSAGVTTIVDRLVRRDILRREVDLDDRRANHIFAQVDLSVEPWDCLTRFDDAFSAALTGVAAKEQEAVASLLDAATAAAALD